MRSSTSSASCSPDGTEPGRRSDASVLPASSRTERDDRIDARLAGRRMDVQMTADLMDALAHAVHSNARTAGTQARPDILHTVGDADPEIGDAEMQLRLQSGGVPQESHVGGLAA